MFVFKYSYDKLNPTCVEQKQILLEVIAKCGFQASV